MIAIKNLKDKFVKTSQIQKQILLGAVLAFASTFLPWSSVSIGMLGGYNYNGWHGYGRITVVASTALVLLWLLPRFGAELKLPIQTFELQKYLAMAMLAGPLLWLLQSNFSFDYLGFGFWTGLIVSGFTLAIFFKKNKIVQPPDLQAKN
ncbi:MAG: hypothetical protein WCV72_03045 [Patescibacteria group bacterium]